MANIGSVFLGDVQRHRLLSSNPSTPPSSPPPHSTTSPPASSISTVFPPPTSESNTMEKSSDTAPTTVDPLLALDLRIRWLEAILVGDKQDITADTIAKDDEREKPPRADHGLPETQTLYRLTMDLQRRFDAVIESNEGLKRFMAHYDQYAHFLTPAFALSGTLPNPPGYDDLSPEQLDALLVEMEPDIRAAERDIREIELLEQKGVTGPGKLASYEEFQPRLTALLEEHEKQQERAASLERQIAILMERHATHTDALSELFVAWDDALTMAEDKLTKLEQKREERKRLGLPKKPPQPPAESTL